MILNVIFLKCNFLFLVSRNAIDLFIAELNNQQER